MRTAEEIKNLLYQRLNHQLRRPRMYATCHTDLESQILMLLHDLQYIEEKEKREKTIQEELIEEGLFFPTNVIAGVFGIFRNIMPDVKSFYDEICSVYARKAYQIGYLEIENILSTVEFQNLTTRIIDGEFSKGFNPNNISNKIPSPSFKAGNIFCYATENLREHWVYFDFSMKFIDGRRFDFLRSIRWSAITFEDGFELTKEGYEETRRGIAQPEFDGDIFVEQWQNGKIWNMGEPLPVIEKKPRDSRWKHLW